MKRKKKNIGLACEIRWLQSECRMEKSGRCEKGEVVRMMHEIREYKDYCEAEILHLYESVGWTNYTAKPEMLSNAYANSLKIFAAYDGETLIGIIRAVGDGFSILYIQDILVLPEYQRKGVGTALIHKLLEAYKHVYQKVLLTDNSEKTIAFYKSIGFWMDTETECRAFWRQY